MFRAFAPPPLRFAVVHTISGQTIRGALARHEPSGVLLRAPQIVQQNQNQPQPTWVPLDGDVWIPTDNIDFWQEGGEAQMLVGGPIA